MIGRNLKAILAALGAAISVLFAEFVGIPEEAGRTFIDNLIELIDMGSAFTVVFGAILTFVLTWFFANKQEI